ncbi:MAG TPA: oligosaccharide flippase family protein [Terriglobales bacterium]|nr:oligosaccharide flippase family protein [Terriglobales bacterium]
MSGALWRLDAAAFEAGIALLALIWLGYPLVVAALARWRPRELRRTPRDAPSAAWPRVSVIVSAHNEAAHIEGRIENLWELDYPAGRLEILIAEDGSTDDTVARVERLAPAAGARFPVRLLSAAPRGGKPAALNRARAAADGEVLVFTDANNRFDPTALRELAAPFLDPSVGAVVGRKSVASGAGVGGGESVYWRYEGWLTLQESRAGSAVSAYGEVLAVRRGLFQPLPLDRLAGDDLLPVLRVLLAGKRVIAAPRARSREAAASSAGLEWERRRRMAVGRWGALAALRGQWARLGLARAAQVLFHQLLRPVSALLLLLALPLGLALLAAPPATAGELARRLAWAQAAFYLDVIVIALARAAGLRLRGAEAPYFFCLAMAASLAGWWRYLRRTQPVLWVKPARAAAAAGGAGFLPAARPDRNPAAPGISNGHILHGLFWASSAFALGKLLVFGSVVVLARILAPRAFGEVALATSTLMVLEILGTLGLTSALIYEEREVEAAANYCFFLTLGAALAEAALAWSLAPRLAAFFHDPALTPMLRALLASLVLSAAGNTHDTLLRRRLAFRAKLVPDVGQAAVKGAAAIALALAGLGAWSLIWGQVLGSAVAAGLLWRIEPWRPAWRFERAVGLRLAAYAKHIYLLDSSSVLLSNFDTLTIGRMLNAVALGFYTLAFRIPEVLVLSLLNVITRVVFPAFSRLQSDRAQLRETLLDTARYTALLIMPLAAGMALLAPQIVYGIYGWRWGPAIGVLRVLALYAGIRCISHHFGDGYKAIGRPDVLTRTTLAWWALLPPSLILGARWGGIVGVAWGEVATRVAITALHVYLIKRYLDIAPRALWRCFAPALESTAAMALAVAAVLPLARGWAPRPELALGSLFGAGVYTLWLWRRHPLLLNAVARKLQGWRQLQATPAPQPALATPPTLNPLGAVAAGFTDPVPVAGRPAA